MHVNQAPASPRLQHLLGYLLEVLLFLHQLLLLQPFQLCCKLLLLLPLQLLTLCQKADWQPVASKHCLKHHLPMAQAWNTVQYVAEVEIAAGAVSINCNIPHFFLQCRHQLLLHSLAFTGTCNSTQTNQQQLPGAPHVCICRPEHASTCCYNLLPWHQPDAFDALVAFS
jgi:cadmium resistance protein CadD (predicted permease)